MVIDVWLSVTYESVASRAQSGTRAAYDATAEHTRAMGLEPPPYRSPLDLIDAGDATAAHDQHGAYQAQLQLEGNRHTLWEQVVGASTAGPVDERHLHNVLRSWRPDGVEVCAGIHRVS
jgi:hypothetical protein